MFLAIMSIGLALRCWYFVGIGGFDDLSYLKHVAEILDGTFTTEFVFSGEFPFRYRAGILFPTAAMYHLAGPSEYTAALFPLTVSMAMIWLAWRAGKLFSPLVTCLSALLLATLPIAIVSATSLLPTVFSAFFCGLSIVWWIELEGLHQSRSTVRFAPGPLLSMRTLKYLTVGLSLGVAYLFRVEAAVSGLVFMAFGLLWWKPNRGWIIAALGIVIVIGTENIVYYSLHGEWFYRLLMISQASAEMAALDATGSPIENAKSPMIYVNAVFFKPTDMGLHGAAIVGAAIVSLFAIKHRPSRPVLIWFWLWLLYLLFGTWSFDSYVPTTKNPRYLQNLCLPGVVLLASVTAYMIERRSTTRLLAAIGLCGVLFGSLVLVNPAWVYRHENAAGARVAAGMIREELSTRGMDVSKQLIQAEYYTAINLEPFMPDSMITPVSHHDISLGDRSYSVKAVVDGFVIHDEFVANKYAEVVGYKIPAYNLNPPPTWKLIASRPRNNDGFQYKVLKWLSQLAGGRLQGVENSLKNGDVLLYEIVKAQG